MNTPEINPIHEHILRAEVLAEAIPFIRKFRGTVAVIKYGGHAMINDQLKQAVVQDIVLMSYVGIRPVIIHGGGPEISNLMNRMGIKPQFVDGLRVTCQETLDIAEMVLAGKLNGEIVNLINQAGGHAVGLSGKDANMIIASKKTIPSQNGEAPKDLGFVGDVQSINPDIVQLLEEKQYIPVISPIGVDLNGQTLNINADTVACELAIALKAQKLILITDVKGIMKDPSDESSVIPTLSMKEAQQLIDEKIISAGMIPKVQACIHALLNDVQKTHVLDGRIPHSLLLEIFTHDGIGTQIARKENL